MEYQVVSMLIFPIFFKCWHKLDFDVFKFLLIPDYFAVCCFSTNDFHHQTLMDIPVWVDLSVMFFPNESLQINFVLAGQLWFLDHKQYIFFSDISIVSFPCLNSHDIMWCKCIFNLLVGLTDSFFNPLCMLPLPWENYGRLV